MEMISRLFARRTLISTRKMGSATTSTLAPSEPSRPGLQFATFAAGCFWGVEKYFRAEFGPHITNCMVGYTGGQPGNPSYRDICTGKNARALVMFRSDGPCGGGAHGV